MPESHEFSYLLYVYLGTAKKKIDTSISSTNKADAVRASCIYDRKSEFQIFECNITVRCSL